MTTKETKLNNILYVLSNKIINTKMDWIELLRIARLLKACNRDFKVIYCHYKDGYKVVINTFDMDNKPYSILGKGSYKMFRNILNN